MVKRAAVSEQILKHPDHILRQTDNQPEYLHYDPGHCADQHIAYDRPDQAVTCKQLPY